MARTPSMLLSEATTRVQSGELVGAACYTREAVRRELRNLCDQHQCRPVEQTPRQLVRALVSAGVFTASRADKILRLVRILDKASRLYRFRPNRMMRAIVAAQRVAVFN